MATLAKIRQRAARKLRILNSGATIRPEDDSLLSEWYDSVYEELLDDNMVSWGSTDDVPAEYETSIVTLLAEASADDFHVPEARLQRLAFQKEQAMKRIRQLKSIAYQPTSTKFINY